MFAPTSSFQDINSRRAQESLLDDILNNETLDDIEDKDEDLHGQQGLFFRGYQPKPRDTSGSDWRPPKPKIQDGVKPQVLMHDMATKSMFGAVVVVTGGSRGIGKGIAHELCIHGSTIYLTGRSTASNTTDKLLAGSVDETALLVYRGGGQGVAVHVDHADDVQNRACVDLLNEMHGRVDVLINNAFFIPKPDMMFFGMPVWKQPIRFLNEQYAVGGRNHVVLSVMMLPLLRRGRGLVINVSSPGSINNTGGMFPQSYLVNKASYDQSIAALNIHLRKSHIFCMTLWPGIVSNERMMLGAKRDKINTQGFESARLSGKAINELFNMPPEALARFNRRRSVFVADVVCYAQKNDKDGYKFEPHLSCHPTAGALATADGSSSIF